MQKQFKYIYNNQEVSKEEFEKLAGDSFKWFDGDSIVSVPFSSFDSFFDGEFKSKRQINEHFKSVVFNSQDFPPNKIEYDYTDILRKKCSDQCYCDESCKKPQEKIKIEDKDDTITSSNRGEKETMEHLQGVKESQTIDKAPIFTYCKVNKNALEALSLRALYGHNRYKKYDEDWQNFSRTPNGDFEYSNAQFRHALEIGGEETEEEHLVASAWNAVARLEIFLRNKSK